MMPLKKSIYSLALLAASLAPAPAWAAECDRTCLSGALTNYIDALVARDPAKLGLDPDIRFTEDSRVLKLGDGLWKTVTGKGTFRHDYLDEQKQVALAHVTLFEGSTPVLYSVALHMKSGKIGGVETLVQRVAPDSRLKPTELDKPIRGMNDPVPAGKRQSRASMIATALTYTEGLRVGNFIDSQTRFAPGTYRVENGAIMAGDGCVFGDCDLYTQRITLHPGIIASVAAVDEEAGIVVLWMNFGFTDSYGPGKALVTFEAFKVWGDEIHSINAFFATLPLATPRLWPSSDPVPR